MYASTRKMATSFVPAISFPLRGLFRKGGDWYWYTLFRFPDQDYYRQIFKLEEIIQITDTDLATKKDLVEITDTDSRLVSDTDLDLQIFKLVTMSVGTLFRH